MKIIKEEEKTYDSNRKNKKEITSTKLSKQLTEFEKRNIDPGTC